MSSSNKADPEWDSHKTTIESLYVKNNLKLEGRGGLMDIMARSHGFAKSKAQYERYFKQWGMRKYRKKDDWKTIGRKVAERKLAGKDSDVCINSEVIPKAKVQKQIRRHAFTTTFEQHVPAPSPRTPEGFAIRTPVAEEMAPLAQLHDARPSLPLWTGANDFPFSHLQNASPSRSSGIGMDDFPLTQLQNATPSFPPWTWMDDLSFSPFEDQTHPFQFWTYNLPFFQLEDGLLAQVNLPLIPTDAQRPEYEVTLGTPLLLDDHQDVSHEVLDIQNSVLKGPETLTAVLKALLPSAARVTQAEEQLISNPNNHRSDPAFPKLLTLLIYAMANNFAGLNSLPMEEIMEYLKRQTNTRLLQSILSNSGPESEAIAEKLFLAAIESEDARIVEVLLQRGLNPNELVCTVGGTKYTPVERSSMLQNIEITRLLLRAKSDVNKTFGELYGGGGAIQCAIHWWKEQPYASLELVPILLDAGGEVRVKTFDLAIERHDPDLLDLLIDFCAKTKRLDLILPRVKTRTSIRIMKNFDNETATAIIIRIFQAVADSDNGASPTFQEDLDSNLDVAAAHGNLGLVQFLLRSRASITAKTLIRAIKSRNKDLVRVLLDAGADVETIDAIHRFLGFTTTPLAEAIRWGDIEVLDLLEDKGAWSRIGGEAFRPAFQATLQAASEVGQLTIVQKLLDLRPPNTMERELGEALVAGICAKQDAIVLTLLDSGANVNELCSLSSDTGAELNKDSHRPYRGPALLEALRQRNPDLVRFILDADVNIHYEAHQIEKLRPALVEAAQWGDCSIIEDLIFMGADANATSQDNYSDDRTALVISVERKDTKSMQILLNAGADVNNPESKRLGVTPLRAAVINGDINMVEHLLSIGADPDDSPALSEALSQGILMIEKLLTAFSRRYPYGRKGYGSDALLKAIEEADLLLIDLLLKSGIDVNTVVKKFAVNSFSIERLTPLGAAIKKENATSVAILQRLLDANGNPNSVVQFSDLYFKSSAITALLAAINTKDIQKVRLLTNAGAEVNRPATKGVKRTPLQKAAEIGSFQIAQLLIEKGALVNAQPAQRGGATAVQLAAIGGYIGIAELLLDNGADVNAPSAKMHGRTALEGAAEYGRIDMLRVLFNAGANFHGAEYERAMQLAKENGHMATRRYLESLSKEFEWSI